MQRPYVRLFHLLVALLRWSFLKVWWLYLYIPVRFHVYHTQTVETPVDRFQVTAGIYIYIIYLFIYIYIYTWYLFMPPAL